MFGKTSKCKKGVEAEMESCGNATIRSSQDHTPPSQSPPLQLLPVHSSQTSQSSTSMPRHTSDRRFNIVLFGIPESPQGSSRHIRWRNDFDRASQIVSNVEQESDHRSSIRDCHRLGKYISSKSRPRPLLVFLNSTADVNNILSHRHLVSSPIVVKPDRSPEERKVEATLLQERWKLIESGVNRLSIKLRGASIYVNGRLHGKVTSSVFSLSPNLGDLAPNLSTLSVNPSAQSDTMVSAKTNVHTTIPSSSQTPTSSSYPDNITTTLSSSQTPIPPSYPVHSSNPVHVAQPQN